MRDEKRRPRRIGPWLLAAVLALGGPASAQHEQHNPHAVSTQVALTGAVTGVDGKPLRGAIVQLRHGGHHVMGASVADTAGRFTIRAGSGTYSVEIRHLGYESHVQHVILDSSPVHLGELRLSARAIELDAMTTKAEVLNVELRSGSTVVHARQLAAAGGSIADLLRTVPGVDIDADGRISMRGSSSVIVLMNGQRMALSGDALTAFLRQMPAAALESVESGSIASARHGADGAAGLINLVFTEGAKRGTSTRSLAGSMASRDHYFGSVAASGDASRPLVWDLMYSFSGMQPRTSTTTARWSVVPGDLSLQTDHESQARETHRLHSILAGTSVTPTRNSSVALRGAYSWMRGEYRAISASSYTNAAGNVDASATGSMLAHVIPSGELSAVATVNAGAARFTSEARGSVVDEDERGAYVDQVGGYNYLTTVARSRQRERSLRNSVALNWAGITLDAGHEWQFRTNTASHDATHFDALNVQAYQYQLGVQAGYLSAQRSIGALRAEAGLRVEAERSVAMDSMPARTALRVFPSVTGRWTDVDGALVYRVAYARRITRPTTEMLDPLSMGGDHMDEVIGNPSLLPEISDHVEAGVERHLQRLTLQVTPFLRWTADPIRQVMTATDRGGAVTKLENLSRARAVGADGSVRARPRDGTVVTLAGTVAHLKTTAEVLNSRGTHTTARLTVDHRIMENTVAQLYLYARTAQAIEQGEIKPSFTSELAVTQQIAGERGRITLRVRDVLRSDRLEFRVGDSTFTQRSQRQIAQPLVSLFLSYAVGGPPRDGEPVRGERVARIF